MAVLIQAFPFTHDKASGEPFTLTMPHAFTAGSKIVVHLSGAATAAPTPNGVYFNNSSGTFFTERIGGYKGGSLANTIHDATATGGETAIYVELNGAENISGVVYELGGVGNFVGASDNGAGNTAGISNNFRITPSSAITTIVQAVGVFGMAIQTINTASETNKFRQMGPLGKYYGGGGNSGTGTKFIWAGGLFDADPEKSYPENLTAGQYKPASVWVAGGECYAVVALYEDISGVATNSIANDIMAEESLPGTLKGNWFLGTTGVNSTIAGYTDKTSYNVGDAVNFKVDSTGNPFRVEIYRLGRYGWESFGARDVLGGAYIIGTTTTQPTPTVDAILGSTSCAWTTNATWTIPSDAHSGVYYVLFRRTDITTNVSSTHFVIKGGVTNKTVVVIPDSTYQAYNEWGATTDTNSSFSGRNLYTGEAAVPSNFAKRAYAVSFDRPYATQSNQPNTYLFDSEISWMMFAQAQGYDLSYISDVDLEKDEHLLETAKLAVWVGHHEYLTQNMWNAAKNAIDAGVNCMFNTSNYALWRTRYAAIDTNKRTMICYKDSGSVDVSPGFDGGTGRDPVSYTGTYRDDRAMNPLIQPEDQITGLMFFASAPQAKKFTVADTYKDLPIFRNSSNIQALTSGQAYTTLFNTIGDEADAVSDTSTTKPNNMVALSSTSYSFTNTANAAGSIYAGTDTRSVGLSLYRANSGALVFSTGSWRGWWGISRWRASDWNSSDSIDLDWQNALLSIMYDLGATPTVLTPMTGSDTMLTDPAVGAPGGTRDDVAISYGLSVVSEQPTNAILGFFF